MFQYDGCSDRYLRVRYEDFTTLPEVEAELVYRWSGLGKTPAPISEWIDDNMKISNCDPPAEHGPTRRLVAGGSKSLRGADARPNAYYSLSKTNDQKEAPRMLRPTSNNTVSNYSGGEEDGARGGSRGDDGGLGRGGGNYLRGVDPLRDGFRSSLTTHQAEEAPPRVLHAASNNVKSARGGGGGPTCTPPASRQQGQQHQRGWGKRGARRQRWWRRGGNSESGVLKPGAISEAPVLYPEAFCRHGRPVAHPNAERVCGSCLGSVYGDGRHCRFGI